MNRPPHILWIITTQWRAQATGYAGDPNLRGRTPHLDAFARDPHTVNFTQAVTPHPFGPFARAAMLTGVPSPENGVRDYYDPLPADARTIAHELRERHNYATAFFGKWHLSKRDPRAPLVGDAHALMIVPTEARGGFDFWEGFEGGFLLNDPWLHGTRLPEPRQFPGYQSDVLCERALSYLKTEYAQAAPQFCVVSLEAPHPPYTAPASQERGSTEPRSKSNAGLAPHVPDFAPSKLALRANVPRGGETEAQARRELAGYYTHIEATDAAIGRLIAGVRAQSPRTLIVFTSAHGDMHGAHGLFRKGWPHEESVRVPLLVNFGVAQDDSAAAISLVDLPEMMLSFVAQAAKPAPPAQTTQQAWQPALQKTHARISMPSVVRLPHQCDRVWRGVRTPARKLILNGDGSPWLFFDLENDPLEMRNLAGDPSRRDEIAALRTKI